MLKKKNRLNLDVSQFDLLTGGFFEHIEPKFKDNQMIIELDKSFREKRINKEPFGISGVIFPYDITGILKENYKLLGELDTYYEKKEKHEMKNRDNTYCTYIRPLVDKCCRMIKDNNNMPITKDYYVLSDLLELIHSANYIVNNDLNNNLIFVIEFFNKIDNYKYLKIEKCKNKDISLISYYLYRLK